MDENSTETSTLNNKKSPFHLVDHGLPSTTQKLKANDTDPATTPPRRPLSDTTLASNSPKQELHPDDTVNQPSAAASQLAQKHRHNNHHLRSKTCSNDDGDNNETLHSSKDLQQPEPVHTTSPKTPVAKMVAAIEAATAAAAETSAASPVAGTNSTRNSTGHSSIEKPMDDQSAVDDLKTQAAGLIAALEEEQENTAWMSAWQANMEQLVQNFKDVRDDVTDSVDILAEFEQIILTCEQEKQQQLEVDYWMNLVAARLFEVEEARQELVK